MRLGIVSDTHIPSRAKELPGELLQGLKGVDLIIHAGDIVSQSVLDKLSAIAPVKAVKGNVDPPELQEKLPEQLSLDLNGYKIGIIHSYQFRGEIINKLAYIFPDCDIIIFGHTHRPYNQTIEGKLFFNPGSPTDRRLQAYHSYGIIKLNNKIESQIIEF